MSHLALFDATPFVNIYFQLVTLTTSKYVITSATCAIYFFFYFEMNRHPSMVTSSRPFLEVTDAFF